MWTFRPTGWAGAALTSENLVSLGMSRFLVLYFLNILKHKRWLRISFTICIAWDIFTCTQPILPVSWSFGSIQCATEGVQNNLGKFSINSSPARTKLDALSVTTWTTLSSPTDKMASLNISNKYSTNSFLHTINGRKMNHSLRKTSKGVHKRFRMKIDPTITN